MKPESRLQLNVRRTARQLGFLIAVLLARPTYAQAVNLDTAGITPQEMMMLPEYCRARYGSDQDLKDYWSKQLGAQMFLHVHHYCGGLNFMHRASLTTVPNQRRVRLQNAVNEFDYVLRNWPADFDLAIEAQRQKARAQAMLGRLAR
jgi:hypothetical protein